MKQINNKTKFGLVGKNISYSFSQNYFSEKFDREQLYDYSYQNFDLQDIDEFADLLRVQRNLGGLNITIPYKETILPFLDKLSQNAAKIGAVNTIRFTKKGKLKGYNTDWFGFKKSIEPLLEPHHKRALILGTGGASKAVAFALEKLGILFTFVSRTEMHDAISYDRINATTFDNHQIIINCTPVGTFPSAEFPDIPYKYFTSKHIAFDLIYNPEETTFLQKAKKNGATIKNGYEMLVFQANRAWKIWHK